MKRKNAVWITSTAVFIALLIGGQFVTAPLGQLVTGSWVNMILIVSVMTCGLSSGAVVAVFSPFFAKLFGIGPAWPIVPFIMAGNLSLAAVWHMVGGAGFLNVHIRRIISLIAAASVKFAILYAGIVRVMLPFFLADLPEKQKAVISGLFSVPQLFTALIGGSVAIVVLPLMEKVRKRP